MEVQLKWSRIFDSIPRFFCRRPQTQGPGTPFISVFSHFLAKTNLDVKKKSFLAKVLRWISWQCDVFCAAQPTAGCFSHLPNIRAFE